MAARSGSPGNQALINEAIRRILLDIVIRGHGERLIGRWSREPGIQEFLERVPYLLDRINQLHLICMRDSDRAISSSVHHVHSYHHSHLHDHRHHHGHSHQDASRLEPQQLEAQNSLHNFVNLIGTEHHWLVRTRDSLGLTPLHKAVLYNNRPIVEFILDRYPDELAPISTTQAAVQRRAGARYELRRHQQQRLIDAQDKYGRSALHYAASLVRRNGLKRMGAPDHASDSEHERAKSLSVFRFLIAKGASRQLRDFRGKTADFYVRHPDQLRAKSIIHLANKLNANYQAAVLSRTLKALSLNECRVGRENEHDIHRLLRAEDRGDFYEGTSTGPNENRESMSVSCADLRHPEADSWSNEQDATRAPESIRLSRSTANLSDTQATQFDGPATRGRERGRRDSRSSSLENWSASLSSSPPSELDHFEEATLGETDALKKLAGERLEWPLLDEKTKVRVKKCLSEAKLEAVNQLVVDGLGQLVVEQARVLCWNTACKRYIENVIPNLLKQLDISHELVATNRFSAFKALVAREPILARIRRPYKRAALSSLHLAVQLNRKSMVAFLVERFPELVNEPDSHGATCLHWAARSLHSDRLYNWLADHFGAQLEGVRDWRGKTAADYRQQAIRLASFEEQTRVAAPQAASCVARGRRESARSSVERILEQTQAQGNELLASGVRSRLLRRQKQPTNKMRPVRVVEPQQDKTATRMEAMSSMSPTKPVDEFQWRRDEAAQVSIGVESPSSLEPDEELAQDSSEQQRLVGSNGKLESSPDGEAARNSRRMSSAGQVEQRTQGTDEGAQQEEGTHLQLLEEFGQLDAADLAHETIYQASATPGFNGIGQLPLDATKIDSRSRANDDSVGSSGCVDRERGSQIGQTGKTKEPPTEALSGDNAFDRDANEVRDKDLDKIIADCIASDQFERLEHLILAGCGQRVQQAYKSMRLQGISHEMGAFLEGRAIEFMQTCEQVHQQVHQCQAHALLAGQLEANKLQSSASALSSSFGAQNLNELAQEHRVEARDATMATATSRETLNSRFHRLSSLLQDNCFIMARDKFGASPLHVALMRSDARLLDYLLRRHPNVASAPDHENRSALHYAAIVLAAYERHGPFKLATREARAYWQVDELSRQVYIKLCARFGHELAELRDSKQRRGKDYLTGAQTTDGEGSEPTHVALNELPRGLYEPQLIGGCCPDYANLLKRYDYLILVASDQNEPELERAEAQSSHSEPVTRVQSPLMKMRQQPSSFESKRLTRQASSRKSGSVSSEPIASTSFDAPKGDDDNDNQLLERLEACSDFDASGRSNFELTTSTPAIATQITRTDQPVTVGRGTREKGLVSSVKKPALVTKQQQRQQQQTQAKRINCSAKRVNSPTSGTPVMVPVLSRWSLARVNSGDHQLSSLTHTTGYSSPVDDKRNRRNKLKANHRHWNPNGKRSENSAGRHGSRNNPARLSVVGGVIVPTIIHNDKMDEIETYDIIYRQPPTSSSRCNSSSSSSASSLSASNSSLNSSLLSLNEIDPHVHAKNDVSPKHLLLTKTNKLSKSPPGGSSRSPVSPTLGSGRAKLRKSEKFGCLNGEIGEGSANLNEAAPSIGGGGDFGDRDLGLEEDDEDGDDDDDDDDREEDDRVERLSNEFEDRVRREKNELRQKVDQIMKEIKLSAKSGKSSRFLASPNDLSAIDKASNLGAGGQSSQQMALTNEAVIKQRQNQLDMSVGGGKKSLTSSGESKRSTDGSAFCSSSRSSCSNSQCSSTRSSLPTNVHVRTSSCSSSSSSASNSTVSSVSSPTTSFGGKTRSTKVIQIDEARSRDASGSWQPVAPANGNQLASGPISRHLSDLTSQLVSKNTYGQTYLHFIVSKSQSSSTLYKVLDHGSHLIGERDIFYRTARDVALQFNLTNNVQLLDKYLIDLFISGHTQLLWRLLNQGYSPLIHVSDPDGNEIMLILKLLKQGRMIHYLLQMADFQRWRDELHTFIRHGYSAGVSELIKKHKDLVGAKSVYSRTSLHLAVLFDRVDMLDELIAVDAASVQAVDNMGRTPLHYAYGLHLKNGDAIRQKLISNGASLEARDVRERTPKYYYIFRREIEDIRRIELELN